MQDLDDRIAEREKRIAALSQKRQQDRDQPLIPGSRTTEFWVVLATLIPWAADQFGIDYDLVIDAAGEVAHAVGADDGSNMPMAIAAAYVIGRNVVKVVRRDRP